MGNPIHLGKERFSNYGNFHASTITLAGCHRAQLLERDGEEWVNDFVVSSFWAEQPTLSSIKVASPGEFYAREKIVCSDASGSGSNMDANTPEVSTNTTEIKSTNTTPAMSMSF
jgi:hypothetical protein